MTNDDQFLTADQRFQMEYMEMPMTNTKQPSAHRPTITISRCSHKEQNWTCDACAADWLPAVFVIASDSSGDLWVWLCPSCLGRLTDAAKATLERHARNVEANAS